MGLSFHKSIVVLWNSLADAERAIEFQKMLEPHLQMASMADLALYYVVSLCRGTLTFSHESAGVFFGRLADDLREWHIRAPLLSVERADVETCANEILKATMLQLIRGDDTSPRLLAAAIRSLKLRKGMKNELEWDMLADTLAHLTRRRFDIKW